VKTPRTVTRRAVSYLAKRLELLHETLQNLGVRLRDAIAQIVGQHVGDTIREVVQTALNRNITQQDRYEPSYYDRPDPPEDDPFSEQQEEEAQLWNHRRPVTHSPQVVEPTSTRLWLLIPPALRGLAWLLRHKPGRRALPILGVGIAAGLMALLTGPFVGALTATAGTVLVLTGLTDGVCNAIGGLAQHLAT
jgi:hypothetical protein